MGKKSRAKRSRKPQVWNAWTMVKAPNDKTMRVQVWNNLYTVCIRVCTVDGLVINGREVKEMVHLSIKRNDRQPVSDWRDKLRIKNELCGPESEAVELYPSMSRVVDGANQFHLWVIGSSLGPTNAYLKDLAGVTFPFGYHEGHQVRDQHETPAIVKGSTGQVLKPRQRKVPGWMKSREQLNASLEDARRDMRPD
jgi:hypothetical protein